MSKNYPEMRERLRLRLKRKKQRTSGANVLSAVSSGVPNCTSRGPVPSADMKQCNAASGPIAKTVAALNMKVCTQMPACFFNYT